MNPLAPHQQRVVAEKAELDERREKLAVFINGPIFGDLPGPERLHLNEQQRVMAEYSSILGARIATFGGASLSLPVIDPGPDSLEREIQAKANKAPRVTPDDLQAEIEHVEIVKHVSRSGQVLRWAVLTARNGYAVVGRPSVSVSPKNDNAEIGERVALENSTEELWPLLGFRLRDKLAAS